MLRLVNGKIVESGSPEDVAANTELQKGRVLCVRLQPGQLTKILEVYILDLSPPILDRSAAYTQLVFRKRPIWSELFYNRSLADDMFAETGGYMIAQKYIEKEISIVLGKRKVEITPSLSEAIENLGYRVRAIMSHCRNAKLHGWKPPKRFGILKSTIALACLDAPAAQETDTVSPVKNKKRARDELVWLKAPPLFAQVAPPATPTSPAAPPVSQKTPAVKEVTPTTPAVQEVAANDAECQLIESPPPDVECISVCGDTDPIQKCKVKISVNIPVKNINQNIDLQGCFID